MTTGRRLIAWITPTGKTGLINKRNKDRPSRPVFL
jgi:hypothetical protein